MASRRSSLPLEYESRVLVSSSRGKEGAALVHRRERKPGGNMKSREGKEEKA